MKKIGIASLALFLVGLALHFTLIRTPSDEFYRLSTATSKVAKGNINGIKVAVPYGLMYLPIEYKNQSSGSARNDQGNKAARTWEDEIRAFSIRIDLKQYMDMDMDMDIDIGKELRIALIAFDKENFDSTKGYERVLRGIMKRLESAPQKIYLPPKDKKSLTGGTNFVSVKYKVGGFDSKLLLSKALPEGEGADEFGIWNLEFGIKPFIGLEIWMERLMILSPATMQLRNLSSHGVFMNLLRQNFMQGSN